MKNFSSRPWGLAKVWSGANLCFFAARSGASLYRKGLVRSGADPKNPIPQRLPILIVDVTFSGLGLHVLVVYTAEARKEIAGELLSLAQLELTDFVLQLFVCLTNLVPKATRCSVRAVADVVGQVDEEGRVW